MKIVRDNINFKRGIDPRDSLGLGDPKERFIRKIKVQAQKLGWDIKVTPRRIVSIDFDLSIPFKYKPEHLNWTHPSIEEKTDILRFKFAWVPINRDSKEEQNPVSIRKVWVKEGKELKQILMARLPDVESAIERIKYILQKIS